MRNLLLLIILALLCVSCANDDDANTVDCSLVFCLGGDIINLIFIQEGQNILETTPDIEITMFQEDELLSFLLDTENNQFFVTLITDSPVTILIGEQQLNLEFLSTFVEDECCSGIRIDEVKVNSIIECINESCDAILEIDLDEV